MAKSPTLSIKTREIIGTDAFSRRREVFGQHDTVFLPSPPTSPTLERGKDAPNFRRTAAYSSMRESRKDDIRHELGFRERKMSDNFTADLNQGEEVDYRHSMTERTRRLSKLRRDFLASNLHEPTSTDPFTRAGTRASMPLKSPGGTYKIGSGSIHKFPFAEPFSTPPPVRKVFLDFGPVGSEAKENEDPDDVDSPKKHQSLPQEPTTPVDHHRMFSELVKRYSPQQKPIDWTLPPTKPRVVAALTKGYSDVPDDRLEIIEDVVEFKGEKLEIQENNYESLKKDKKSDVNKVDSEQETSKRLSGDEVLVNGQSNETSEDVDTIKSVSSDKIEVNGQLKESSEDEKNDIVPELTQISRQNSREAPAKRFPTTSKDDTLPALLEKISQDGKQVEASDKKKVKRKRSFLDKLLNRNKK